MIDGLKPYPRMKDSGVPWLGAVPEHWRIERLKSSVSNVIEQTANRESGDLYVALEHVESWTGRLRPAESHVVFDSQVKRFRSGDILFGKLRPYLAKVTRPTSDGVCVGEFLVLRPRAMDGSAPYLELLLRSKPVIDAVNSSTFGAKMPRADWQFVGGMPIARPPLAEQAAIVCFLDHVDRRIRRYIRAKQKLIKLLEEQKQAIIHRAVTRGLDPNVHLKPSGVEWLGDVPEHWEVRRNSQLFVQRNQTGFAELPILEVSLKTGIRIREFENTTRKQVMSDREKYKRAAKGDIAYNMMRMWQGAVGVVPVDGLVSPAYVVARPFPGIDVRYFANLFRTAAYMSEVDNCSRGIVKDRNRLYWQDFKQIFSPYPPPAEQVQIADAIDECTRRLKYAIDRMEREIALLREYRTRLIADVVTGKLDVREAAATLPDESGEPEALDDAVALVEGDEPADGDPDTAVEEAEA